MLTVGNIIDLKKKNIKSIVDFCRFKDHYTKKQIADHLNLSFATVSNMTNSLIRIQLFENADNEASKYIGRSPKQLKLNSRRFSILSLELQENNAFTFYLIDLARNVLFKETCRTEFYDDNDQFMANLSTVAWNFIHDHQIDMENVIGAGVVVPGIVDEEKDCVMYSSNKALSDQPVRKQISHMLQKPVFIENDANLAAYYSAASTRTDNLVYVYMGNGLGLGSVTGGGILRGIHGYSSEIAHVPLGRMNRKCPYCGNCNCLQTDLSKNGFLSKYHETDLSWARDYDAQWKEFEGLVGQGDRKAIDVVHENANILAKALTIIVSILRPEGIVIGGISRGLYDQMVSIIESEVNSRVPYNPHIHVCCDEQYLDSMAKGAAEIVYDRWYPDFNNQAQL